MSRRQPCTDVLNRCACMPAHHPGRGVGVNQASDGGPLPSRPRRPPRRQRASRSLRLRALERVERRTQRQGRSSRLRPASSPSASRMAPSWKVEPGVVGTAGPRGGDGLERLVVAAEAMERPGHEVVARRHPGESTSPACAAARTARGIPAVIELEAKDGPVVDAALEVAQPADEPDRVERLLVRRTRHRSRASRSPSRASVSGWGAMAAAWRRPLDRRRRTVPRRHRPEPARRGHQGRSGGRPARR